MILTFRRPGPPDTHALTMVNNVIAVVNYVIAAHPSLLNFMIADSIGSPSGRRNSAVTANQSATPPTIEASAPACT
jgi:hypothetical protein